MARTFIGELLFLFKDQASAEAAATAKRITGSLDTIAADAARLSSAPWGATLQARFEKLGATATHIDKLRSSWNLLNESFKTSGLTGGAKAAEIEAWKIAATSRMAAIGIAAKENASHVRTFTGALKDLAKLGAYSIAGGSMVYGGGLAVRGGLVASAEREREIFRQKMANIPIEETARIMKEAQALSARYPSVGATDIMEMGRTARAMMGDTERALQVLPTMVKGLVTLQSAKGGETAVGLLNNLLRGIDNAGKNQDGEIGVKNTNEIISGLIRASQIDPDIDVGSLWQFMRRAKIAGPGLSTEFLSQVAPAIIQDITANTAGTSLSSAFQAFVIGSKSTAGKVNIAEQVRIGIRNRKGLVGADLMGANPYEWVKDVLIPALSKDGVNVNDDNAVAKAVAKLSMNSNATAMLTKMVQQRQQIDRDIAKYREAMGPDAADQAAANDPFVSVRGFTESLRNLAAAVGGDAMPTITAGLNSLTSGVNALSRAWADGDPLAKAGLAAGAAGGVWGAWKVTSAIGGLITAGTNLNAAAVSLEAAALSLRGGSVADNLKNGGAAAAGGLAFWLKRAAGIASLAFLSGDTPEDGRKPKAMDNATAAFFADRYNKQNPNQWRKFFLGAAAEPGFSLNKHMQFDGHLSEAKKVGAEIKDALSVTAKPEVDNSALQQTLGLINSIKGALAGLGAEASAAAGRVERQMQRNFADYGVTP